MSEAIARKPAVMKYPCRHMAMPDDVYRMSDGLSGSALKRLLKSPLHFISEALNPTPPTEAQLFGTAVHEAILGSHGDSRLVMRPDGQSPYTNEGKKWKSEQLAAGRIIVNQENMENIEGMRASLRSDPELEAVLSGPTEVSLFAELNIAGHPLLYKGRVDALPKQSNAIFDAKTIRTCESLDKIAYDCLQWGYHISAWLYLQLANATLEEGEEERDSFTFVFIEDTRPWGIRKVLLSPEWYQLAEEKVNEMVKTYLSCMAQNKWPGYPNSYNVISLPKRNNERFLAETIA